MGITATLFKKAIPTDPNPGFSSSAVHDENTHSETLTTRNEAGVMDLRAQVALPDARTSCVD